MTKFNLKADGVANGLEAIEMVNKSLLCCPYRIIFMDINMPVMDGLTATRNIMKNFDIFMAQA